MLEDTTLVLGGGGQFGVAWMTGLLLGLEEAGLNVRQPRQIIGTSAGSVVGAQLLSSGLPTLELFERQVLAHKQANQRGPDPGNEAAMFAIFNKRWPRPADRLAALCELAGTAQTISWEERRADIIERLSLPCARWPARPLKVTAVDVESGALRAFDEDSGIELCDAITASCAVPGVWPVSPIAGRRYIDGGVWRTAENAHLAAGAPSVVVLSPFGRAQAMSVSEGSLLGADIQALREAGSRVALISADAASLSVLRNAGAFEPEVRGPSAEAGRVQGRKAAATVRAALGAE